MIQNKCLRQVDLPEIRGQAGGVRRIKGLSSTSVAGRRRGNGCG